ncbi:MAG TPA: alpha/beta hydrolase [Burkholderiaceae bacterium]|nr:alpha/beta hydrolase [Burkholderiaceae bacterium]HNB46143.1 alpha/beta hydrolase [Burkholderiaceae bacterium]HNG80009.1 alpha/beta hydrolase [Burkholderiaceae bacterium]
MLDPQARALLDLMEARGVPPTHTLTPQDARRFYRERRFFSQPDPPEVGELRELRIPGPGGSIPARLYRPLQAAQQAGELPVLVYFHGGGWTIGDLDTHDTLCRQLANTSGCALIAVDYRLGPEAVFPAAVDDCVTATRWVHRQAASLGLDATRIAVGGDSAGGNLAAVVAITLRDDGDVPLRWQLLIYPATDMRAVAPSHTTNGQGYLLTSDAIAYFRANYLPDRAQDSDWRASPLLHEDLSRLPPALLLTAGFDPLRDEGRQYADRLSAAGCATQYLCFERQLHGFITMGRLLDEANTAVDLCARALRRALLG